jgi:purine-nucleoside phosphorylase
MKSEPEASDVASQLKRLTRLRPSLALILGSGFQAIGAAIRATAEVNYSDLPGFVEPRVTGHAGRLSIGYLGPTPVILLNGRAHYYEGHTMAEITFPVRVLAEFGIKDLVLTNAAGGINLKFRPGDFMCVTDHLNFMGTTPLRCIESGDNRFIDLTQAYDLRLQALLKKAAKKTSVRLHSGIYAAVCGPCYETPAEIRAFARVGADAIGMSTVPEVILARYCGLAVAAVSCITNPAAGRSKKPLNHKDVLATGEKMKHAATDLISRFAELYALSRTEN